MADSPDARWTGRKQLSRILGDHHGPPTPHQRRVGNRIALSLMFAALLAIILLDRLGVLH